MDTNRQKGKQKMKNKALCFVVIETNKQQIDKPCYSN